MHETLPLSQYGLGDALVSPLSGGSINNVYRVESRRGVFVLKEYTGAPMDTGRLQRICGAMALLKSAGLPVPQVISTNDGSSFAVKGPQFFLLTGHVSGRLLTGSDMSDAVASRMGMAHAKMLDVLEQLEGVETLVLPSLDWIESHLHTLLDLGGERRTSNPVDEEACLMLEQKLRLLDAWSGPVPALRAQWTHGDYTWRNVLFDASDELVAIVDFDNLRFTSRGRDVMRCFTLSFPHLSTTGLSYFRGYAEVAKPAPEDVREYVNLYHYMSMYGTWPADVRYLEATSYQRRWDEFIGPRPLAWETGWDELAERLVEVSEKARQA